MADGVVSKKQSGKRLALPPGKPLPDGLGAAWTDMLKYARAQVQQVEHDPVVAVHEFRKSIRRCRSMLRLLRRTLPREDYHELRAELRDIHQSTSQLRDRDVVLRTLDSLALDDEFADPARASFASAKPAGIEVARDTLQALAPRVKKAQKRLVAALPDVVRWRVLTDEFKGSYRRARDDMQKTQRGRGDEVMHDWRKRAKALLYQAELLTHGARRGQGRTVRRQLSRLSEELGIAIDLMVLEDYIREHAPLDHQDALIEAVHGARARQVAQALVTGRKIFRRKPKKFIRRLLGKQRPANRDKRAFEKRKWRR